MPPAVTKYLRRRMCLVDAQTREGSVGGQNRRARQTKTCNKKVADILNNTGKSWKKVKSMAMDSRNWGNFV